MLFLDKTRNSCGDADTFSHYLLLVSEMDVGRYIVFRKHNETNDLAEVTCFKTSDYCSYFYSVTVIVYINISSYMRNEHNSNH